MTIAEKIALVRNMTGETDDNIAFAYLELAGDTICHYADPYKRTERENLLHEYGGLQVRAAVYYLNKRGAEGEETHNENGVNRAYETGDLPPSMLREITPICGVVS